MADQLLQDVRSAIATDCDTTTKGIYFHRLGTVHFCRGRYQDSLTAFTTALGWLQHTSAVQETCRAALDAGITCEKLGDLSGAEKYYLQYLQLAKEHNLLELASSFEFHLSEIYAAQRNMQKQQQYLQQSVEKEKLLRSKAGEGWRERFSKTKVQVCVDSYLE
jgi:tetratricopeptide (TPR) repeat protein